MDMQVDSSVHKFGVVSDAVCGSTEFHNEMEEIHSLVEKNTGGEIILTTASNLFGALKKASQRIKDQQQKLSSKLEELTKRESTTESRVKILTRQLEDRQKEISNQDFLYQEWGAKVQDAFMSSKSRFVESAEDEFAAMLREYASDDSLNQDIELQEYTKTTARSTTYLGCSALSLNEDKGFKTLVDKVGTVVKNFKAPESFRDISQHEFWWVCFKKAVEMLDDDGAYKTGNSDAEQETEFIKSFFAGTLSPDNIEYVGLDAKVCYGECQRFATKMNIMEDAIRSKSELALLTKNLTKHRSDIETLNTEMSSLGMHLELCQEAETEIETAVAQLAIRYQNTETASAADSSLEAKIRMLDTEVTEKFTRLKMSTRVYEQNAKTCTKHQDLEKNLTCQVKELQKEIYSKSVEVKTLTIELEDEKKTLAEWKLAEKEYLETKVKLFMLLRTWYANFFHQIEIMELDIQKVKVDAHLYFMEKCHSTQQAFVKINSHDFTDTDDQFVDLPMIWDELESSIDSRSKSWDDKAEHFSNHLKESLSFYSKNFVSQVVKEENRIATLSYSASNFQRVVTTFMAFCPVSDPSFCSTYLVGWFDKKKCNESPECKEPCTKEQSTCQAPASASRYLLELRIDSMLQGQKNKLSKLEVRVKTVTEELEILKQKVQGLYTEIGRHQKNSKECKTRLDKFKASVMASLEEEIKKTKADLQELKVQKAGVVRELADHRENGLAHMKKIQSVTQELKERTLKPGSALKKLTDIF